MKKLSEILNKITDKNTGSSIRLKLLLAIGIAAMLLLSLPDMCKSCGDTPRTANTSEESAYCNPSQYAALLEDKLETLISSIEGAGEAKVMVTLQNGIEYIYASEDKTSLNTSENTGSNGSQSSEAKENSENNYIIIKDSDGEKALIRTELMPSINGVVVICEGADDPETVERIKAVVTTALNISSKRVCITLLSKEQ